MKDELLTYEAFVASRELQTFEPSRRRAYARYVAEWAEHASTIAGSVRPCGGIGENERMMNAADLAYQAAFCDGGLPAAEEAHRRACDAIAEAKP